MRPNERALDELRTISIETGVSPYAEGSCMIKCGGYNYQIEKSLNFFLQINGVYKDKQLFS